MITELLTAGAGAAGGLGGGASSGPVPNATSQDITNKAKGNVFKGDLVFGSSVDKSHGKGKGSQGDAADEASSPGEATGFGLTPLVVMAAMVFILVLISIVALVGR